MVRMQRLREGDFVETEEGFIFDVKGLVHPQSRVIAYVRYVPDPRGDRVRGGIRYRKLYKLEDRREFLRKNAPMYLYVDPVFGMEMQEVPLHKITRIYRPNLKVKELLRAGMENIDRVERLALDFTRLLSAKSGVSIEHIGISGSVLVGLHGPGSDIDLTVYGKRNGLKVYDALRELMADDPRVEHYGYDELLRLYRFRSEDTAIPFKAFLKVEQDKCFQGTYMGRDFFVRFIPDWDEVSERYGDRIYRSIGYCVVKAEVVDDSESLFTPCSYRVSNVEFLSGVKTDPGRVREVCSFRGRFCKQAHVGETVRVSGKLEKVESLDGDVWFRIVVGERRGDYIIPERLL